MTISTTATSSSIDNTSSPTCPSSDTIMPKGAAPVIGKAASYPSLWRSILDTHGSEILKYASDQFLDVATTLRLETISARDLVNFLANAGRLTDRETDDAEADAGDLLVYEPRRGTPPRLDGDSASTLPGQSASTHSPRPLPVKASREPKRQKTVGWSLGGNDHPLARTRPNPTPLKKRGSNSAKGGIGMRDQRPTSAMASRNSVLVPGTKIPSVLQGDASPAPRSEQHIQRRVRQVSSSDAKKSRVISTQRTELVVITDTEPESSEDDGN